MRNHYVAHLGAPHDVVELSGNPDPAAPLTRLEVACFAPAGLGSPVVYATCGVSSATMRDGRRIEALCILRPAPSKEGALALVRLLGRLGLHAATSEAPLAPGSVLRGVEGLEALTPMNLLLALPPLTFVESFHRIRRPDGNAVQLLWVVPVSEEEARYGEVHGPEALVALFAASGVDLSSWRRSPADTSLEPSELQRIAEERARAAAARPKAVSPAAAPPAPVPPRRAASGPGSFEAQDAGEEILISRKPRSAPAAPSAAAPRPAAPSAAKSAAVAAAARAKAPPAQEAKPVPRFELPQKPASPPRAEPRPASTPATSDKQARIAELKAKAIERAERAEARKKWTKT